MSPRIPQPVSVQGGSGGIAADSEAIAAMARRFGGVATETLHTAWTLHGYVVNPGLGASAVLDPVGFAEFEADLLEALDGPRGLTALGLTSGALDGELRAAGAAYRVGDTLATRARDEILGLLDLPGALAAGTSALITTHDPVAAGQAVLASDPQLADTIIDTLGLPGLLAAGAKALPDGYCAVRELGVDSSGSAGRAPRNLTDLIGDLAQRNDGLHGAIDVRIVTDAAGARKVIVDITGTKSWSIEPTSDVTSLTTNGRALVGLPTAYEQGVLAAMRQAGVRATDDVMLVGHSEGGLVAVNAARDAINSGEFNVTHVITAGAPVGLTVGSVPSKVKVLALENKTDVIPHLDGVANPDKPNVTTASSAHGNGTIVGDHNLRKAYEPVAADVQASTNPSIRSYLASASGYFHGTQVETHVYQITRRY